MRETSRAAGRIASNYLRLLASVLLGLYLVRLLLRTVGDEGMGLVALLASTVGIVTIVEEAASWSMIRELGAAHHSGDRDAFRRMFNSALALCSAAALIMLAVFGVMVALLPLMEISQQMLPAARWFVIAKGIESAALVALAPHLNMYLVTERMAGYNLWLVVRRAMAVLGALMLFWLNPQGDSARGLMLYGWLSAGLTIAAMSVPAAVITWRDRRLVPSLGRASRQAIKAILGISGWNIAILVSQTLNFPVGQIIMNLHFGVLGNLAFGLSTQLAAYSRMATSGMTMGLDAVSARLSTVSAEGSMRALLRHSTMLHGLVAFPAAIGIGVLARPFLEWWVGSRVDDPTAILPITAMLTRILLVAFAAMCVCDNWTRILFGAGHVRRYAPVIIAGNICTPLLGLVLLAVLPEEIRVTSVAWACAAVYVVFYLLWVPHITGEALGLTWGGVMRPLLRPLIASIACAPVLLVFLACVESWTIWWLGAAALAYALAYAAVAWTLVLSAVERSLIRSAAARFIPIERG